MKKGKIIASALALALTVTTVCVPAGTADAAKKPKLNKTKTFVEVGKTIKLKVKKASKKAKVTWKSSKKAVASVKKNKKAKTPSATVKGVSEGKAKITAVYKLGKTKKTLKCTVTVTKASAEGTTPASPTAKGIVQGGQGTAAPQQTVAPTQPGGENNTPEPTKEAGDDGTATAKPSKTPRPSATPSPSPSPTPHLVNPYKVDLSTVSTVTDGVPGGVAEVKYNEETKSLDATMEGQTGFIVYSPVTDRKDEYKYVEITYNLNSVGDVNIYAGQYDAGTGQDAAGWSPEIKLNQYDMDKETKLILSSYDYLDSEPLGAIKIFNFGADTNISVTDITFYMDGDKSEEIVDPDATKEPEATEEPEEPQKPNLAEPYEVDLSKVSTVTDGIPGDPAKVTYNEETKSLDAVMPGMQGFIVRSPITESKDDYKYVEITYTQDGEDVGIFAGQYDAGTGQGATGWSPDTNITKLDKDKETTLLLSSDDYLEGAPLGSIKIFNYGGAANISIKSITFYKDGAKSE